MPPPLTTNGQVTYAPGNRPTVDQMAKDVAAFLVWTAEPNLESAPRRRAGGRHLPAVRHDPRLSRLSAALARRQASGAGDRAARPEEPGENAPRQGQAGRRRLSYLRIKRRPSQGGTALGTRRSRIVLHLPPTPSAGVTCVFHSSLCRRQARSRSAAALTATSASAWVTATRTAATARLYGDGYGGYYGGYGYGGLRRLWQVRLRFALLGWYDNYYYPGSGIYVYDSYRRPRTGTTARLLEQPHKDLGYAHGDDQPELERLSAHRNRVQRQHHELPAATDGGSAAAGAGRQENRRQHDHTPQ